MSGGLSLRSARLWTDAPKDLAPVIQTVEKMEREVPGGSRGSRLWCCATGFFLLTALATWYAADGQRLGEMIGKRRYPAFGDGSGCVVLASMWTTPADATPARGWTGALRGVYIQRHRRLHHRPRRRVAAGGRGRALEPRKPRRLPVWLVRKARGQRGRLLTGRALRGASNGQGPRGLRVPAIREAPLARRASPAASCSGAERPALVPIGGAQGRSGGEVGALEGQI